MASPLWIGTFVWIVLSVLAGYWIMRKVGQNSNELKRQANQSVALVSIVIGAIQMWMMWITCYMHQMYPLVAPKIQF